MPNRAPNVKVVAPRNSQLQKTNKRIASLVVVKPYGNFFQVFSLAARLAGEAIDAATELQQMPGADAQAFRDSLDFWHRLRDYTGTAALNCVGGNQTLAEALVTSRLMHAATEEQFDA